MNKDVAKYMTFKQICKDGQIDLVSYNIKDDFSLIRGLQGACEGGHIDIVKLIIERCNPFMKSMLCIRGTYSSDVIKYACKGGNIEIINYLKKYDNTNIDLEPSLALYGACDGGHIDIVNLTISKGADGFGIGLYHACKNRHIDIINLLISKGTKCWNAGLRGACKGGHMDIINLMISKGANNWSSAINSACKRGHMNVILLLLPKLTMEHQVYSAMFYSYLYGNTDVLKFFVSKGYTHGIHKKLSFPYKNRKTKFFHNLYIDEPKGKFMHISILYWAILYSVHGRMIIHSNLLFDLLKIIYF